MSKVFTYDAVTGLVAGQRFGLFIAYNDGISIQPGTLNSGTMPQIQFASGNPTTLGFGNASMASCLMR